MYLKVELHLFKHDSKLWYLTSNDLNSLPSAWISISKLWDESKETHKQFIVSL